MSSGEVVKGLVRWEEDEEISAYVSNPALQRIDEIKSGNVSKEAIEKLKKQLSDALESINEEVDEIGTRISQNRKDLKEKKEISTLEIAEAVSYKFSSNMGVR